MLSALILGLAFVSYARANNFPSLITTNATLAVVIDKEFLAENFDYLRTTIEKYLVYLKRDVLKHGGVNVQYYSWTTINVKRDITAILSVASCFDTWRLFRAADEENILHMAISESDCPRLPLNQAVTIPLIKKGEEMPQMLLDLRSVNAYNWKSIVIIFDDALDRDMITRILTSITKDTSDLQTEGSAVSLIKLDNSTTPDISGTLADTLSAISTKVVGSNFLVVVSVELVASIMKFAKSLGLVHPKSQWLYVISDVGYKSGNVTNLKAFLKEGDNVAFIYNITDDDLSCKGGLQCHVEEVLEGFCRALDAAVVDEFELAGQVSDEEWEAIRPTKSDRRSYLIAILKTYFLQHGTCDNCTTWQLTAGDTWGREYKAPSGFSADLIQVGYWRPSDGPSLTDALFPHVAHGFRGKTLPVVSFHNPPWQIFQTNQSGSVVSYRGLVFDVIDELAKSLNFTYAVEVVKDDLVGRNGTNVTLANNYKMEDITTRVIPGSVIDLVRSKQVMLTACLFTVTEQSKMLVNFTIPVSIQAYTFLVARPKELSRALLFMSPFTKGTWLCLSATIITMGPVLFYIHRLSPVHQYKGISLKGGLSTIQNCIWYMYGALLQQGGMYLPYADSARLIVGSWWLVVLVLSTTYCGNLVAFLTFPKNDRPVTTIDELLSRKGTLTWSMATGSFFEHELKVSDEAKHRSLYRGAMKNIADKDAMITDVENGRHVLIDWKIRLQYIMKQQVLLKNRCELALGTEEFFDEQLGMVLSQESPYIEIINEEIKRLHQVGLTQKWLKDYLPKKDKCFNTRNAAVVNNHTVNLDDMQGSFFVLIFGFTLAFLWMCGEKLWYRYKLKREKKVVQPFAS